MIRCFFLLTTFIGFFATSTIKADVCDSDWWITATEPDLKILADNEEAPFPEFCNVWKDTPLHIGIPVSQNAEVIAAFLDITEADVLAVNEYEETPLNLAQARLNTANTRAEYARETAYNARMDAARAHRTSGAMRHLRGQLTRIFLEARERRDQALNEQRVAEAIHQILLSKSQ